MSDKVMSKDRPKGPWGRLQHFPFFLECPAVHLDKFHLVDPRPGWSVNFEEAGKVLSRMAQCGLPDEILASIQKPWNQTRRGDQIVFFPPEEGVLNLAPEIRAAVYRELGRFPANVNIAGPFLTPKDQFDTWFANTSLRPELISLIKQMSYQRGDAMAFSDQSFLAKFLRSEAEGREVLAVLTRTPALMLQLVLDQKSKITEIASYWSTGEARRSLPNHAPFLKSIQSAGETEMLDVVHLLPPLPRKLLNTHLDPVYFDEGEVPDCHWSSLNFFKSTEEPFFLHSHLATTAVLERYQPVKPPYRFGDILTFLDNVDGNAFHSCVYIADDVVFTKNGRNILSPWVFQSLAYVKMTFLYYNNGRIVGYRSKA
jgi:hypothetical protein